MAKGGFSSKKLDPRKSSRQTHYRIRVTIPTALGYVCLPKLNAFGETRSRFYLHSSWPDLKAQLTNFSPANKLGQQLIHRFYLDPHWRGQKASFTQDNLQKIVSIFLSIPSVLYPLYISNLLFVTRFVPLKIDIVIPRDDSLLIWLISSLCLPVIPDYPRVFFL